MSKESFKIIQDLGTVTDKKGAEVIIRYCNYIGACPDTRLMSFFYKNMAELIDRGHAGSNIEIHNKCRAVYTEIDNKIVGICVIDWNPNLLSSYIVLTAIDKDYRGRGLYRIIFDFVEQESKKLGALFITSMVNIKNEKNLEARKSVGMQPIVVKTVKYLT